MKMFKLIIFIFGFLLVMNSVEAKTYCENNNLVEEIEVNGENIKVDMLDCQYGCNNVSYIFLGYPACEESEILMYLLIIAVIVIGGVFIRWFYS